MRPTIHVAFVRPWEAPATRPFERTRLETLLLSATGAGSIGRLCPRCGSPTHGRPWVAGDQRTTSVSLSYTDGLSAAAWSSAGTIGIDVERETDRDAGVYGDLATWTRAEAILKATGEGLHRDPTDLPDIYSAPLLELPAGYVGHVALDAAGFGPGSDVRVATRVRVTPSGAPGWEALVPLLEPDPLSAG